MSPRRSIKLKGGEIDSGKSGAAVTDSRWPSMRSRAWRWVREGHGPLVLLIAVGLAAGVGLGRDFGMTVDEVRNAGVGEAALAAYGGSTHYFDLPSLDEHGPAYFMLFAATSKLVSHLDPDWTLPDGRHLTNYALFLAAVAALYVIARQMLSARAAWATALIFGTQPLLFGHAFINQKDIPFMTLFTATVAAAVVAAERMREGRVPSQPETVDGHLRWRDYWRIGRTQARELGRMDKLVLLPLSGLALLVTADVVIFGGIETLSRRMIALAYQGQAPVLVQRAFNVIASDAYKTPLALYLDKFDVAWFSVRLILPVIMLAAALILVSNVFPVLREVLGLDWTAARKWTFSTWLLVSALLLGLTVCVRQLGIFAGVLASAYIYYRNQSRSLMALGAYWVAAGLVTVATWPYLWPNPVGRFLGSLYLAAHFPATHDTFYRGVWLDAGHYPWYFLPNLTAIELTEPAVLLILVGAIVGSLKILRKQRRAGLVVLLALWAGIPAAGLMFFHMTTYGNISHLLFTLPALFLIAGLGIDWLAMRLRRPAALGTLLVVAVLPGLLGIASLHPYEYIYINGFAGGVSGAYKFYELDRWCISIREAIDDLNAVAAPGATVMLPSDYHQAIPFARPDIRLVDNRTSYDEADYVVQCSWVHGLGPWPSQDFEPRFEVARGRAILAQVWQRKTVR
jgi:4-amino-4-deoxy-L-arabinose transferase-like glycosyltransferase